MADDEQLAILYQGVDAWNPWRQQNPDVKPDLSKAVLIRADLPGAELSDADLSLALLVGVNLKGADLSSANLVRAVLNYTDLSRARLLAADLTGASLLHAKLHGSNLRRAKLTNADLQFGKAEAADLSSADLTGTNLSHASLVHADLTSVNLNGTVLGNVDLSRTRGLDTCRHAGPSILNHGSLQLSGDLPLSFLRGCGLPDNLIEYLPSLLNQPIQFYSCFISYSSKDDEFAKRLHADLQDRGIRCWFAPEDMKIGDRIRTRIDEVIRLHEKLLLVLSVNSMTSDWVEKEVETAFEKEQENKSTVLFPVRLDDAVMDSKTGWAADIKRSRHIGDFRCWKNHDGYRKAFERLLRDLKVEQAL